MVAVAPPVAAAPAPVRPAAKAERELEIHIGPLENPAQADGIAELFRDIPGLGTVEPLPCDLSTHRAWRARTSASDADLMDLFTFHVGKEDIRIVEQAAPVAAAVAVIDEDHLTGTGHPNPTTEGRDYGFFDGAPGVPVRAAFATRKALYEVSLYCAWRRTTSPGVTSS